MQEAEAASSTQLAARRRWPRIVLIQLVLWPLLLLGAELCARWVRARRGELRSSQELRAEIVRHQDANRDFVPGPGNEAPGSASAHPLSMRILHPYVGFETLDGVQDLELVLGRPPANEGQYDILILGGSVAAGFSNLARARLSMLLMADPRFEGRRPRFLRFARAAFKQPQQLQFLIYLFSLGIVPHAVLNIDGFNELALGYDNAASGIHPIYPAFPQWGILVEAGTEDPNSLDLLVDLRRTQRTIEQTSACALSLGLHRSNLLGELTVSILGRLRARTVRGFMQYHGRLRWIAQKSLRSPEFEKPMVACVRTWFESSRTMHDLCQARSVFYLHVLQPTLHDAGSKPLTPREVARGVSPATYVRGVQVGYPLLRDAAKRLIERGEKFVDCSRVFAAVNEELYYDGCHFNQRGNDLLAEAIAEAFLRWMPPIHREQRAR